MAIAGLPECGDSIDSATFEQILEMDEDEEERDFSKSLVYGFFEQAEKTFGDMDVALERESLVDLSTLGHFLKGSSATLGLNIMKAGCEKMQNLGHGKDETGTKDETDAYCLEAIKIELVKLRQEYAKIEAILKQFFGPSAATTT